MSFYAVAPRLMQDISSYRPRHANIGIDHDQITSPTAMPARPKNFNHYGKEIFITLNTFNAIKSPNTIVYQYDVSCARLLSDCIPLTVASSTTMVTPMTIQSVLYSRRFGTQRVSRRSLVSLATCGFGMATSLHGLARSLLAKKLALLSTWTRKKVGPPSQANAATSTPSSCARLVRWTFSCSKSSSTVSVHGNLSALIPSTFWTTSCASGRRRQVTSSLAPLRHAPG